MERRQRIAFGDWQTPLPLADAVLATLAAATGEAPRTVLEPTCGLGAFLAAAATRHPDAALRGLDVNAEHLAAAAAAVPRAELRCADFFAVDWARELALGDGPLWVVGNPPWVTAAQLGRLAASNRPQRGEDHGLSGYEAITGRSNFDVSEWMICRLLDALAGRPAVLGFLCKTSVARAVALHVARRGLAVEPLGLWTVDARHHFGAAVDAVLLACRTARAPAPRWPVYAGLTAAAPRCHIGAVDGRVVRDLEAFERTRWLGGASAPEWRSGLKHDCASVMELTARDGALENGLGERVEVEQEHVYPLLKGSDLAHGRPCSRRVIVPQRALGEDTRRLEGAAPKTWAYLQRHAQRLAARRSAIYRERPPFAVFGVGAYSFSPWKVAVSGLHKRLGFRVVGPAHGRPTLVDDTCYFLPFASEPEARRAAAALGSPLAAEFLAARLFWDAKRPISKALLQSLDLAALLRATAGPDG